MLCPERMREMALVNWSGYLNLVKLSCCLVDFPLEFDAEAINDPYLHCVR